MLTRWGPKNNKSGTLFTFSLVLEYAYMIGGKKIEMGKPERQQEQMLEGEENRQRGGELALPFG